MYNRDLARKLFAIMQLDTTEGGLRVELIRLHSEYVTSVAGAAVEQLVGTDTHKSATYIVALNARRRLAQQVARYTSVPVPPDSALATCLQNLRDYEGSSFRALPYATPLALSAGELINAFTIVGRRSLSLIRPGQSARDQVAFDLQAHVNMIKLVTVTAFIPVMGGGGYFTYVLSPTRGRSDSRISHDVGRDLSYVITDTRHSGLLPSESEELNTVTPYGGRGAPNCMSTIFAERDPAGALIRFRGTSQGGICIGNVPIIPLCENGRYEEAAHEIYRGICNPGNPAAIDYCRTWRNYTARVNTFRDLAARHPVLSLLEPLFLPAVNTERALMPTESAPPQPVAENTAPAAEAPPITTPQPQAPPPAPPTAAPTLTRITGVVIVDQNLPPAEDFCSGCDSVGFIAVRNAVFGVRQQERSLFFRGSLCASCLDAAATSGYTVDDDELCTISASNDLEDLYSEVTDTHGSYPDSVFPTWDSPSHGQRITGYPVLVGATQDEVDLNGVHVRDLPRNVIFLLSNTFQDRTTPEAAPAPQEEQRAIPDPVTPPSQPTEELQPQLAAAFAQLRTDLQAFIHQEIANVLNTRVPPAAAADVGRPSPALNTSAAGVGDVRVSAPNPGGVAAGGNTDYVGGFLSQ
jgi:hypothetical protein